MGHMRVVTIHIYCCCALLNLHTHPRVWDSINLGYLVSINNNISSEIIFIITPREIFVRPFCHALCTLFFHMPLEISEALSSSFLHH
jgi:hypothetical protein